MRWDQLLQASDFAEFMRTSAVAYPAALSVHLLGMAVLVGTGVVLDVRLIGWTATPLRPLLAWLFPVQLIAGVLMVVSGTALALTELSQLLLNPAFQVKMVLLGLLLGNALGFTVGVKKSLSGWEHQSRPPAAARLSGWTALVLWPATVVAGRLIAFT